MSDRRNQLLSWIEIDAASLEHNLALFRSLLPAGARLLLVVKSNAYGHGTAAVTRIASRSPVDALGVHQLDEAAAVRSAGWTGPVLVMGYVPRERLAEGMELGVDFTVYNPETLDELDRLGRDLKRPAYCHLKLETGTWRQGVTEEDLPEFLEIFRRGEGLRLAGLSMHFANIEDTTDHSFARTQFERFQALSERIREAGFAGALRHVACTAALLTMPETGLDLARLGIGAYGIWPSRETMASARTGNAVPPELRPVLTWKARIAQLKWVPSGSYIGYGCTHRVSHRTRIAVVPVGYAEGYDRGLSGLAHVLVHGIRAQVLGRICMNIFMCDVTDIPGAAIEDEVVLIGRQGSEEVRAADLAGLAQTIPYEIVSRITPALPRILVDADGRPLADPT